MLHRASTMHVSTKAHIEDPTLKMGYSSHDRVWVTYEFVNKEECLVWSDSIQQIKKDADDIYKYRNSKGYVTSSNSHMEESARDRLDYHQWITKVDLFKHEWGFQGIPDDVMAAYDDIELLLSYEEMWRLIE
jgi:hypothetical protein